MNVGWIHISTNLYKTRNPSKHIEFNPLFFIQLNQNFKHREFNLLTPSMHALYSLMFHSFFLFLLPPYPLRPITLKLIYNTQKTCQIRLSWTWGPNKRKPHRQRSILEKSTQGSRRTKEKLPLIKNLKLILSTCHRTLSI